MNLVKTVTIKIYSSGRFDRHEEPGDRKKLTSDINKAIHAQMPRLRQVLLQAGDVDVDIEVS